MAQLPTRLVALTLSACWLALSPPGRLRAQDSADAFLYDDPPEHALRVSVEMDPALAFGLGYTHSVDLDVERFHRQLGVHVDVTTILGGSSWDFSGGVTMLLAEGAGPNVSVSTDLELKIAQNDVHDAVVYGYGATLRPGWYDPVWYLAAEVSVHGTFAATIFHHDAYRAIFPAVQDGTYTTDNLSFFLGGVVGFRIERAFLIGLRFAWRVPRTGQSYEPYFQPYTVNLELGWSF